MATSGIVRSSAFSEVERLSDLMQAKKSLIVVGYGLSAESGAPHFYDLQSGVWASAESVLNPFRTGGCRDQVIAWLKWRMALVAKCTGSGTFRALSALQAALGCVVISQCPNGLVRDSRIAAVDEPYGNLFSFRCIDCGQSIDAMPLTCNVSAMWPGCPCCAGTVLPKVSMFGADYCREMVASSVKHFEDSELLIDLGAEDDLQPFCGAKSTKWTRSVVKINGAQITVKTGSSIFVIQKKQIQEYLESSGIPKIKGAEFMTPYQLALSLLRDLYLNGQQS